MNNRRSLKILIISYDWRNIFENNFEELIQKLKRDRLAPDFNQLFIISWSTKTYYKKVGNVVTIHLKTFLTKIRIVYDFLLIFFAPLILKKRNFKPDFIIVRDFPLVFAAFFVKFFFKSKIVFFLGSLPTDLAKKRKFGFFRWLYQYLSEFFTKHMIDNFIANGEATREYFIKMGVSGEKVKIMTEDVVMRDKDLILASVKGKVRKLYNISDDKKMLLSVGRLEKEKGFDRLLRVFSAIKKDDLILLIVGSGVLKDELINQAKRLGIENKVIFTGFIFREEIWNYYKDADAFILLSYSEGNPTVFREAMYMGVPAIGSKIKGIIEFVGSDGDRGFLWDEKEGINKLEEKISKSVNNSKEVEEIKKRARSYIEENINNEYIINDFL